jgi:hypothetical protein
MLCNSNDPVSGLSHFGLESLYGKQREAKAYLITHNSQL